MDTLLQLGLLYKESAPSGAQLNAVVAFAGMDPKWLAGIANRIATLRPEDVLDCKLLCRAVSPSENRLRPTRLTVALLRLRDTPPTPVTAIQPTHATSDSEGLSKLPTLQ